MAKLCVSELLPQKFIKQHGLLLFYNDLIADLLLKADEYKLSHTEFTIKDEDNIPDENENILYWMIEHGLEEKAFAVTKAQITFSLVRDFIFYMHESFDCAERGKVTVSFTLSRKPIKDNLFYLCWLLVDSDDLINKIMNSDIRMYDVTSLSEDMKKNILNTACQIVNRLEGKDILFDLIYKRDCEYGLSSVWDQSIHLVTCNKNYRTSKGNLNFVFASDKIWGEYWELYYNKMPYIMNVVIEVIIKLFEEILKPDNTFIWLNKVIRDMKFAITYKSNTDTTELEQIFRLIPIKCDNCGNTYKIEGDVLEEFIYDYLYTCPYCGKLERVGEYFYSNLENEKKD